MLRSQARDPILGQRLLGERGIGEGGCEQDPGKGELGHRPLGPCKRRSWARAIVDLEGYAHTAARVS